MSKSDAHLAPNAGSCQLDKATGTLALFGSKAPTRIVRSGQEIKFFANDRAVGCAGGTPTVTNVDTIKVETNNEFDIDLRNGQFAPGRTPESDGSSEIEIRGAFRKAGGVRVIGSSRRDYVRMGVLDGQRAVNLNANEPHPDADVRIVGGFAVVSVLGRGGGDVVKATGGAGFDGPLDTPIAVSTGAGRDKVVGTDRRDLIGSGRGGDVVRPLGGRDRVRTQGGADRLRLRDRLRDVASCGSGNDHVRADRIDKLAGCET